jgi:hypothetical protein
MKKSVMASAVLATALAVSLALALGSSHAASRNSGCKPVNGHLVEDAVAGPGLQTTGRFWGGIQAAYEFALASATPTGDPSIPTVVHFVGHTVLHTRTGDIRVTDAGALDVAGKGNYADLMTITGGTDAWAGASGQIQLVGFFTNGHGEADYRGEVCGA